MKFLSKPTLLIFSFIAIFGLLFVFLINIILETSNSKVYFHSETMDISVTDKFKKENENATNYVNAKNLNDPYQEFSIALDDERIWNLINIKKTYFVNINWESARHDENISNQITTLLRIEQLKK
ncbi:hypothetical protein JFL43_21205 [Viridibacillus sp. YIM B01967]|uniref:DUF3139 domain-containing protein n=1 Tax=Viridibacillus soli TaxID=2798301 RepID=A0ABS1HD20_9BACL|nr:hypothetical protein [Viridibacillus soli]MBK3497299.1 hypothetical protein [Viridibacillus soli]